MYARARWPPRPSRNSKLAEQKKFVAKIDALQHKIAEAQAVISGALARKQAILKKYL
jgi:hypothetical protein